MKLVAALLVALAACSGTPATEGTTATGAFPLAAYASIASDSGAYRVEVRTSPNQPPVRGELEVELRVSDVHGAPVDGLSVDVLPWMPVMGHGTSLTPEVAAEGKGGYRVTRVSLFMQGTWELRVALAGDHLTVPVTVQ